MQYFLSSEIFLLAVAFDLLIGDPLWLTHPTQIFGYVITFLENILRRRPENSPKREILLGSVLVALVIIFAYAVSFLILWLCFKINYWVGVIASGWLLSTTIAIKGLAKAGHDIFLLLQKGDIQLARQKVGYIVGRDTDQLSIADIVRATVETVAENIVDGIISPLFYALIGGVPLALAYRAINTMDSMLGYKNEKYLYFGRAAALVDDVANYIPARITAGLLLLASVLCKLNWRSAWKYLREDAKKHPSPNSGLPEATVAGALGISLGGLNYYGGIASNRAIMGEDIVEKKPLHIITTIRLMYCTCALGIALGLVCLLW
ncbi:adenosylcobinamide-phosphate synthase CbiB [Bacillota bacterium LX-D]|nr:adenosylcobinamide-phosphate synthase CbiB [Bacillota bacterium LX-D]